MADHSSITELTVAGYGCVREARVQLTPLHALIGPNDSGKSTLLRALRDVCEFGRGDADGTSGRDLHEGATLQIAYEDQFAYRVASKRSTDPRCS